MQPRFCTGLLGLFPLRKAAQPSKSLRFLMKQHPSLLSIFVGAPLLLLLTGISDCTTSDADGDGYTTLDGDCDDSDASVHPLATERCDGIDSNCYALDEPYRTFFLDVDQDGWGDYSQAVQACQQPSGTNARSGDCDDEDSSRHPRAVELCNGIDEDCNGLIDDGLGTTRYRDADGDGFGSLGTVSCGEKTGYIATRGDCDDSRADTRPGALDAVGDGRDQDCGGFDGPQPQLGFGSNPASSLQSALDSAQAGATVWVGPGVYPVVNVQFPARSIRLMSTHLAEQTTFDAQQKGRVLSIVSGNGSDTLLDGFSIKNGYFSGENGGGILVQNSSPTFDNMIFENNRVGGSQDSMYLGYGGAMALVYSYSVLRNTRFVHNEAIQYSEPNDVGGGYGGALYLEGGKPILHGIVGEYNDAVRGGFLYGFVTQMEFRSITLRNNSSHVQGQAIGLFDSYMELYSGSIQQHEQLDNPVVYAENSGVTVADLTYFNNRAPFVVDDGMGHITDSTFVDNEDTALRLNVGWVFAGIEWPYSLVKNNLFLNNVSTVAGNNGALYIDGFSTVESNTFVGNSLRVASGVYIEGGTNLFDSNLFAYNIGTLIDYNPARSTMPTFTYNNFYNPSAAISPSHLELDTSNIQLEPRFVAYSNNEDSSDDSVRLLPDSSVKDSGNPALKDSDGSRAQVGVYGADALPDAYTNDQDKDGLYDGWEKQHGLNTSLNDAAADVDQDGATNLTEFNSGLNPALSDCDGDGQKDGTELTAGSDPLDWYQRVADSGGGIVTVAAQVPGDFTSPQAAIRAIKDGGEIVLGMGDWPGPLRVYGKDLTLTAPAGATIVPVEEGALLDGRGATLSFSRITVKGGQNHHSGPGGFWFIGCKVDLEEVAVIENVGGSFAAAGMANMSALTFKNVRFERNVGLGGVPALEVSDGTLDFEDLHFVDNISIGLISRRSVVKGQFLTAEGQQGGTGVMIGSSEAEIEYCRVANNVGGIYPGGLEISDSNVFLSHCIVVGNDSDEKPGIRIEGNPAYITTFDHAIIAYNQNSNLQNVGASATVSYSNFYNPSGVENTQGLIVSDTTTTVEPLFMAYDADGIPQNLHLSPASPLVNAGSLTQFDADGSRADLGVYGGAEGDVWDRDQDGTPDYFWPGAREQAPRGFTPLEWDLDDGDPGVK